MADAFERLQKDHGAALHRVVASYAASGPDRDDLAQEVALAVWQALPRFRGESSERAFVLRIAHNRGLTWAWRRARLPPPAPDVAPEPVDPRPRADERVDERRRTERLFAAMRELPIGQRQVLALALEGLAHAEIAVLLEITPENVAVRLGRAREALKKRLSSEAA